MLLSVSLFLTCSFIHSIYLKMDHFQALAQCEHTLTKIGLVREAVDDTAGAAKVSLGINGDLFLTVGTDIPLSIIAILLYFYPRVFLKICSRSK